jgi:hypothetical protein
MTTYQQFLADKAQIGRNSGFEPLWIPDFLFDFQKSLCEWSITKGRGAIFADCGLGKTPMQLVWAQNVVQHTNKPVLILTPLSVGAQTVREGSKFGIECHQSKDGTTPTSAAIVVTNYERLHHFNPDDFAGVACDESSILKNFDGATKEAVTEFMRKLKYRLLCTATAAPNDYIELGTSSEALGELGYMDMLKMFFKAADSAQAHGGSGGGRWSKNPFQGKFRFRGHAERDYWRWVCSWARAVRKPSDLGFDDGKFTLPELVMNQYTVKANKLKEGCLFEMPAQGLSEQREERRRTLVERCEMASEIATKTQGQSISWCSLNDEGDLLSELIPDSVQVSGKDSDDFKEESFLAFSSGQIKNLVSKSVICGFGLNFQNCAHQTHFPSHSFEQWYQAIRRSWRFGQDKPVTIDMITSEGEASILANLKRKAAQAESMFSRLVELMNNELQIHKNNPYTHKQELPSWL